MTNNEIKENLTKLHRRILRHPSFVKAVSEKEVYALAKCREMLEEYDNGWIPCEKELPPYPNSTFEGKYLELYLATVKGADYPFRVFWNGECFVDGFSKVNVLAWQPLPKPYQPEGE